MMAEQGKITVNDVSIIHVDADPDGGGGVAAPIGSLAMVDTDGGVYKKTGAGATAWTQVGFEAGKIIQIVQTVKTDAFSTSTSGFVDITGLSANITPSSNTSKILVICHVTCGIDGGTTARHLLQLQRDSSDIYEGDAAGSRTRTTTAATINSTTGVQAASIVFLDSPATTSSVEYKVQSAEGNLSTATRTVNRSFIDTDAATRSRYASSITLMEVVA